VRLGDGVVTSATPWPRRPGRSRAHPPAKRAGAMLDAAGGDEASERRDEGRAHDGDARAALEQAVHLAVRDGATADDETRRPRRSRNAGK